MTESMAENRVVRLRATVAGDAPFLGEMLVAAVNWDPERHLSRDRILADPALAHYVAGWPRPGDGGVTAFAADRQIGAAWWRLFAAEDPGYGFVAADVPELSIGVVPAWRGRGVGRRLLRAAMASASGAGWARLSLSVERANRARELYLAEGFRVVDRGVAADTMAWQAGHPSLSGAPNRAR